jgi:hypothetical protein
VQQFLSEFIEDSTVVDIYGPLLQILEASAAVLQRIFMEIRPIIIWMASFTSRICVFGQQKICLE